MKLVIDRSKWRTGGGSSNADTPPESGSGRGFTELLNLQGYMCCLGFFGLACGYSMKELQGKAEPSNLTLTGNNKWPSWFQTAKTSSFKTEDGEDELDLGVDKSGAFMNANDDERLSREGRERRIAHLFADHGVFVEFVGKYVI